MKTNKTKVETRERELIMDRIFDAPPELMFEMWSHCKHLKHWWGPSAWPMEECSQDFREGGIWHYCLRGPNEGDESWGKAVYKEIVKADKIIYNDYFSDKHGNINQEMPSMLITVEFKEYQGRTRQISTSLFDTPETLEKIVEMGAIEGMTDSQDRLDEYLTKITKA